MSIHPMTPLRSPISKPTPPPRSVRMPTPMTTPGTFQPSPNLVSPQSTPLATPISYSRPPATYRQFQVPQTTRNGNINHYQSRSPGMHVLNPISPRHDEPIMIHGSPFNTSLLTPIPLAQSYVQSQTAIPDPQPPTQTVVPQQPIPDPQPIPTKKVKKNTKSKPKPIAFLSWDQMTKNYQIPEYSLMPPEQQRSLRQDFSAKFNIMKSYFPHLGITDLSLNPEMTLTELHVAYARLLDHIATNDKADQYKLMLVFSWLAIEYGLTRYLGLKSGGYAFFQTRNISKYNHLLAQLGEVDRSKGFSSWSPMTQIMVGSTINLVIFVIVQTFLENTLSVEMRNELCNTVGSFFTSTDSATPAGMAGIPGLLANHQDPANIANVGSGIINQPGGLGGMLGGLGGLMSMFGGAGVGANNPPTATKENNARPRRVIED